MSDFLTQASRFETWCRKDALPFWAGAARDPNGGFYEQLFLDGAPDIAHSRRVRVQARLSYVYAHAAYLGWFEDAKDVSDHAWDFLTRRGFQSETGLPGCAHLLNADGTLLDGTRDTYAQAFVLLAGIWRYKAFADDEGINVANETLNFLNTQVQADNGGWLEGLPASLPRRQNPHMHLFEALLTMHNHTGNAEYLGQAHNIYALFETHFFDRSGDIIEFFEQDWSRAANNGGPAEPGHMMEWCWLLRCYETQSGVDVSHYADRLYDRAVEIGLHPDLGLLCDSVSASGKQSETLRSWPQTEYIKASVAQARAGRPGMDEAAAKVIERVFETYLNAPVTGGWQDQLTYTGQVKTDFMPSSSFYHWICAAAEVSARAKELSE